MELLHPGPHPSCGLRAGPLLLCIPSPRSCLWPAGTGGPSGMPSPQRGAALSEVEAISCHALIHEHSHTHTDTHPAHSHRMHAPTCRLTYRHTLTHCTDYFPFLGRCVFPKKMGSGALQPLDLRGQTLSETGPQAASRWGGLVRRPCIGLRAMGDKDQDPQLSGPSAFRLPVSLGRAGCWASCAHTSGWWGVA